MYEDTKETKRSTCNTTSKLGTNDVQSKSCTGHGDNKTADVAEVANRFCAHEREDDEIVLLALQERERARERMGRKTENKGGLVDNMKERLRTGAFVGAFLPLLCGI